MARHRIARRTRAMGLLPIAALSAAWAAGLPGSSGDAARTPGPSAAELRFTGPPAVHLPSSALAAPASVSARTDGSGAATGGTGIRHLLAGPSVAAVPAPALAAYQRAAQVIDAADPSCRLGWPLLAAIGQVESDHGQADGSTLSADGRSTPGIFGPTLDGTGHTRVVEDTDGGEIDGDPSFDRAVGPMQFIPSTWSAVKVDGDGDGVRDPQDIDDAALGAAVYLCSGGGDLSARPGERRALLRYNQSARYANLVLGIMDAYSQAEYTAVPAGIHSGTVLVSKSSGNGRPRSAAAHPKPTGPPAPSAMAATHASAKPEVDAPPRPSNAAPTFASQATGSHVGTDTVGTLTGGLPVVLTRAQATVVCLEKGISRLDLLRLAACVSALSTP